MHSRRWKFFFFLVCLETLCNEVKNTGEKFALKDSIGSGAHGSLPSVKARVLGTRYASARSIARAVPIEIFMPRAPRSGMHAARVRCFESCLNSKRACRNQVDPAHSKPSNACQLKKKNCVREA